MRVYYVIFGAWDVWNKRFIYVDVVVWYICGADWWVSEQIYGGTRCFTFPPLSYFLCVVCAGVLFSLRPVKFQSSSECIMRLDESLYFYCSFEVRLCFLSVRTRRARNVRAPLRALCCTFSNFRMFPRGKCLINNAVWILHFLCAHDDIYECRWRCVCRVAALVVGMNWQVLTRRG